MSDILSGPVLVTPAQDANSRHAEAKATLGTRGFSDDSEYVYVGSTAGTVNSGEPVSLVTGFSNVVRGDADLGGFLGIALVPFASGEFGYVKVKGPTQGYVASGVAAGGRVELSGTVGQLKALTSSGVSVGIALESSPDAGGLTDIVLGPQ